MAELTKRIMRRIYFIWFARQVFNAVTVKFALVGLLLWQFVERVSITNVIANWQPQLGFSSSYAFAESALLKTEFAVQMLMLGMVVVAILLVRDIFEKRRLN